MQSFQTAAKKMFIIVLCLIGVAGELIITQECGCGGVNRPNRGLRDRIESSHI
jgi:hypothetical protein